MNETLAMVMVGLLFSMSAGVRMTLPLLGLNLLAYHHVITLPASMAWLGTEQTLILLGVAFIAETLIHFVPVVGTGVKAISTPLIFAAGTLIMAVPLAGENPLVKWTLAGVIGGGLATLTHVGVTGLRTMSSPANLASGGLFGIVWNVGEMIVSVFLSLLGLICVYAGWIFGAAVIVILLAVILYGAVKGWTRLTRLRPV